MEYKRKKITVLKRDILITENPGKPLLMLVRLAHPEMGLWDKIWNGLSEYYSVCSINLTVPPFDRFDSPGELFTYLAKQCVDTARELGHEKFHLFGWQGGAQVGMRCLVDYPGHLHSCIMLGAIYNPSEMRPTEKTMELLKVVLDHGDLELYTYFWLLSNFTRDYSEKHFDRVKELVETRLRVDKGRLDTTKVLKWLKIQRGQIVTDEEIDKIDVPTLLVAPAFDGWPTLAQVRRLHAKIKTSELAVVPGSGPFVLIEDPDAFWAASGRFIRAASRGTPPASKLMEENNTTVIIDKAKRVEVMENRAEEAVVFLHGWLMSSQIWAGSMNELAGRIRCVAPWQPAHGKSAAPEYGFTMDQWTDWLADTLNILGIRKAILVGHSMGGMLSMAAALKFPEMVRGLVLVGTTDEVWEKERNEEFLQMVDIVSVSWGPDIAQALGGLLLGERYLKTQPASLGTWTNEVAGYDRRGMAALGRAIVNREDLTGLVPGIKVPTLVMHGSVDNAIEVEKGRALARRIPGAKFQEIPESGHCPPLEKPEIFTEKLVLFLKDNKFIV